MAVSSTTSKVSYTATASQTVFAYTFKIYADADLKVYVNDILKTLTTDYTVSGAGTTSGGNVTFGSGLSASDSVVIERVLTLTQGTDYVENDPFPAETHEDALDRLTFIAQQHQDELDRTVKFATTVTDAGDVEVLGSATARASKLFAFDSSGDLDITQEIGVYKGTDATTTTAAYIQRDIVKSTTTAQLNNVYICTAASPSGTALTNTSYWALLVDAVSAASSATSASSSATAAASSATAAAASETAAASSETAAASSASSASTSAATATTQASAASTSATAAASSATSAAASYDSFDDRYLGTKTSDPSTDNDGDTLVDGALYFNTTNNVMMVYDLGGTTWNRTTPTSSNQTNINTVSGIAANVTTVAGVASNVTTVAGIASNVTTVAGISANTTTVAGIASDVTTAAGNNANITTVATNITKVSTVANDITKVVKVADDLLETVSEIETVADDLNETTSEIDTVAASITNVDAVGTDIANVNTVAANISGVNSFGERYRVAATAPTTSLDSGDLYFDTASDTMKVYGTSGWQNAGSSVNGTSERYDYVVGTSSGSYTGSTTTFPATYDSGYVDVYLNGAKLAPTDFTSTSGTEIVLVSAASTGNTVSIIGYGTFSLSTAVSQDSPQGAADIPAGTTAQRPSTASAGMFRYNSTLSSFEGHDGSSWGSVGGGATGTSGEEVIYLNETQIDNSYTIPSGYNGGSFGPVTLATGVSVTIPTGSTYTIV